MRRRPPPQRRPARRSLAIVACLVAVAAATAACEPDERGCATAALPTTVAYRSVAGVPRDRLSLDVHAPADACRAPVVVWVHGGGYAIGDKANQIAAKARLFNARGWILVSVNYRLTDGSPTQARFPDHYDDVASALAWVSRNIRTYGGDQSRLALLGHSAGADIVANVANQTRYLHARGLPMSTVDCVAPLDTEGFDKVASAGDGEDLQWERALGNEPEYRTVTSATRFIDPALELPDTLTVYRGTAQRQQIQRAYADAVEATGAAVTLVDVRSLSHAEVNSRIGAAGDTVMTPPLVSFLARCLR